MGRDTPMPRRPNKPPIFRVETMSDGREWCKGMVDDFTGRPISGASHALQEPKPLPSGQELQDAMNRAKANAGLELLARFMPQVVNAPPRMARLAHNQRMIGEGLVMT